MTPTDLIVRPHRWSGWPGAICLDCGIEDQLEICLADDCPHTPYPTDGDWVCPRCPIHVNGPCVPPAQPRHSFRQGARDFETLAAISASPPETVVALRNMARIWHEVADIEGGDLVVEGESF